MPIQFLPQALAALGAIQGYRSAKDSGASGIGRILSAGAGAFGGYNLGSMFPGTPINPTFANIRSLETLGKATQAGGGADLATVATSNAADPSSKFGLQNILRFLKKDSSPTGEFSAPRVASALAAATYLSGAFDPQPTDIYMPGYNMSYLTLRDKRPKFTYIDPTTGQEKEYQQVYAPEEQGRGDKRIGPYSMVQQRLKTGGLAEIKKFNEGGVNYLPSKMTHDENDSNNYVRATGYVEDGAGVGDKDEDTMLAQLADGEFVTRADGVLGAGIIAGANPNSMKDMREKGAQYFYEQQRRYKRVFDLLKDRNGDSKQKIN